MYKHEIIAWRTFWNIYWSMWSTNKQVLRYLLSLIDKSETIKFDRKTTIQNQNVEKGIQSISFKSLFILVMCIPSSLLQWIHVCTIKYFEFFILPRNSNFWAINSFLQRLIFPLMHFTKSPGLLMHWRRKHMTKMNRLYCVSCRNGPYSHLSLKKCRKVLPCVFLLFWWPTTIFMTTFNNSNIFLVPWLLESTGVDRMKIGTSAVHSKFVF